MIFATNAALWDATLTEPQYLLTLYFLVIAALALFVGFLRTILTKNEVGARYRGTVVARLAITGVATVSYVALVIGFFAGYTRTDAGYVPTAQAVLAFIPRYMDWSLNVPLLTIEIIAVSALVGVAARRAQWLAGSCAFLMIFTGFLGAFIVGGGRDTPAMVLWGSISCVFWIFASLVVIRAVRQSCDSLTPAASRMLRQAAALLLSLWVIYPLVFALQLFTTGGGWTTAVQIILCATDVTLKLGFGTLIHSVAKLRTAEDVRLGDDVHPESIWISSVKQSDAGMAREVFLNASAQIHPQRSKPPLESAVATEPNPQPGAHDE